MCMYPLKLLETDSVEEGGVMKPWLPQVGPVLTLQNCAAWNCSRQLFLSHLPAASSSMTSLVVNGGPGLDPQTRTCPYVCCCPGSGLLWVGCVWMMKALMLLTDTPIPRPNKHLYHPIHYCHRHRFHHRLFLIQVWEEIPHEITCCLITQQMSHYVIKKYF